MAVAGLPLYPYFTKINQWLKRGSLKCNNSDGNNSEFRMSNREIDPTANIKCESVYVKTREFMR